MKVGKEGPGPCYVHRLVGLGACEL